MHSGRATTIWGYPVSQGYRRTQMSMEFFFWLKRLEGFLLPLHSIQHYKSRKQKPQIVPAKLATALTSATNDVGDDSAISAALALQTEGGGLDLAGRSSWGQAMKNTTERDSSESETEVKVRVKEQKQDKIAEENPTKSSFCWNGFGHDNDVVRIGRYGRLRNSWDKPRRRRLGFEAVPNSKTRKPCGRPIVPDYSSSEDSCTALIDEQKTYRSKPRDTRRLIKKQKERVTQFRRAMKASADGKDPRRRDREGEFLSSLYGHYLGPFEPTFQLPRLRTDWPGSPLDSYEESLTEGNARTASTSDSLENRLEMALSSSQKLGIREECWTHLTDKKGRVRGIEPYMDHDPTSKIPLGFMGFGTDLSGSEYQLIGIDTNEFWRRMGDNKVMNRNLCGFEDLLKGW